MRFHKPVELNIDVELNSEWSWRGDMERMGNARGGSWLGAEETHSFGWPAVAHRLHYYYSARSIVHPPQTTFWFLPRDAKAQKKAGTCFFFLNNPFLLRSFP